MSHLKSEAFGYIKDMFIQHNMVKRTVLSFISVLITGFAISLFSLSGFGVDPFTSMNMNISSVIGMSYGTYQLIVNIKDSCMLNAIQVTELYFQSSSVAGSNMKFAEVYFLEMVMYLALTTIATLILNAVERKINKTKTVTIKENCA